MVLGSSFLDETAAIQRESVDNEMLSAGLLLDVVSLLPS